MLNIGSLVTVKGEPGVVRYLGKTEFAEGEWVGVELHNTAGRNDGSVLGKRYFLCSKPGNYGVFVRPALAQPSDGPSHDIASVTDKLQLKLRHALTELESCRSTISKLQLKLNSQNERIDDLETSLERLVVSSEYHESENAALTQSLSKLESQYLLIKKEYDALKDESDLNKQLEEEIRAQAPSDMLSDDIVALLVGNKKLEEDLLTLSEETEAIKAENTQQATELKAQVSSYQSLNESYLSVTKQLQEAHDTIAELQDRLLVLMDLELVVEHMTRENEALTKKAQELQQTINELNELHDIDKALEEDHLQTEKTLRAEILSLLSSIKREQEIVKELNESNSKLKQHIEKLKGLKKADSPVSSQDNLKSAYMLDAEIAQKKLHLRQSFLSGLVPNALKPQLQLLLDVQDIKANFSVLKKTISEEHTSEKKKRRDIQWNDALLGFIECVFEYNNLSESQDLLSSAASTLKSVKSVTDDWVYVKEETDHRILRLEGLESLSSQFFGPQTKPKKSSWILFANLLVTDAQFQETIIAEILEHAKDNSYAEELQRLSVAMSSLGHQAKSFVNELESNDHIDTSLSKDSFICKELDHFGSILLGAAGKIHQEVTAIGSDQDDILEVANETLQKINFAAIKNLYEELLQELSAVAKQEDKETKSVYLAYMIEQNASQTSDTLQNFDKDKQISDLTLSIEMLRANMSSTTLKLKEEGAGVKKQLKSVQNEYDDLKKEFENLRQENIDLEKQLQELETSNTFAGSNQHIAYFTDLKEKKSYTEEMAYLEEIALLRKMLFRGLKPRGDETQDIEWLKEPTKLPKKLNCSFINQAAAKRAAVMQMLRSGKYQTKDRRRFLYDRPW